MARDRKRSPARPKKTRKESKPSGAGGEEPRFPTVGTVKRARKADLLKWLEEAGLPTEGRVVDLRARLVEHLESKPPAEPAPAAEAEEPEAPEERPARARPEGKPKRRKRKPEHVARTKPELGEAQRRALALRAVIARGRPRFLRQEWFRYKRLGTKWRRPQGGQSKLRRHFGYRPNVVSVGYRSPALSRGLHPSGFAEVLVHNVRELEGVDPKRQAVRVAHAVGSRNRSLIQEEAEKRGIRILNPVVIEE